MFGAREQLRNTEQNVLLSAVGYYMDVLRDTAILDLDRNNVEVLQEQLRQTQDRFNVGEVTRTDVAQAEASLAGARGDRARRAVAVAGFARQLSPGDRRRSEEPRAGCADVAPTAKGLAGGDRDLAGRASAIVAHAARRRRGGACR